MTHSLLVIDMGGLPVTDTGLCAAAGDWGMGDTTDVMDMTLLSGGAPSAAIWSGRAGGDGATGLMASCGLATAAEILDEEVEETAVLGLGESCDDDMGEAGDIGVLLLLL